MTPINLPLQKPFLNPASVLCAQAGLPIANTCTIVVIYCAHALASVIQHNQAFKLAPKVLAHHFPLMHFNPKTM